jgi:carboxylate-amine ligase
MTRMRTLGVEEEFLLVDDSEREVRPLAGQLLDVASELRSPDDESLVTGELKQEQAEVASQPRSNLDALRDDLAARRRLVAQAARTMNARVAAVATCPTSVSPTTSKTPRYQRIHAEYGLLARTQLTCGTHVHVAVESRTEGIAVLNRIRPWLSVLLALSANSPFWNGEDSDYASYRTIVWGRWPTAGPAELFVDEADYDRRVNVLIDGGVILDTGMIYYDARLSANFPTVEIRVADACTDLDVAVLIAALSRGLVDTAARDAADGVPPLTVDTTALRSASWRAARSGMSGHLFDVHTGRAVPAWDLASSLFEFVQRSLVEHGDAGRVERLLADIRTSGTGADLQRAAHARRGNAHDVLEDAIVRTAKT